MNRKSWKYRATGKGRSRRKNHQFRRQSQPVRVRIQQQPALRASASTTSRSRVQTALVVPAAQAQCIHQVSQVAGEHSSAAKHRTSPISGERRLALRFVAICLAPIAVCMNFTNYGSLIPLLQKELHVDSSQIGLFSTLLFLGIALTNIPGGILADRFGSRATMLGSLLLVGGGALLFPLFPDFVWMAACRSMIGLGAGAALVAGSHATAELGKYEALGQGLNGGVAQLGAGLGLFVIPRLLGPLGWRGALFASGLLAFVAFFVWLLVPGGASAHGEEKHQQANPAAGVRTPAIWMLGLSNMGTFGLSNAVSAWLAVYFTQRYGFPLALAASLGSLGLFAGIIFRPLGGLILARSHRPLLLIRVGTLLALLGIGVLALPIVSLPLAFLGLLLLALGTTLPYAAIFSTAASVGRRSPIGAGVAQGLIAVLASPAAIVGPPVVGLLLEQTNSFTFAFGALALTFPAVAVVASWCLHGALKRTRAGEHIPGNIVASPAREEVKSMVLR